MSVDSRVVDMQFRSNAFADGVKSTIDALTKLRESLKLDGASKGLDAVSASANKNFADITAAAGRGGNFASPMIAGAGQVTASFTAMQAVALTALSNIVNRAINAGSEMSKSLTIAPITSGFDEYELKMGSIQTIMSGSGASLKEVNQRLQELNEYSDKTIYSFADMTQSIGKFTNSGVSLEMSVASIKGVANAAALAGANSNEASRAMYNFAQSLSQGYVGLVDWKSIELANMGTVEFKQQLIDAAVAVGDLTKKGKEYVTENGTVLSATKNFNLSLQDQWLSSTALTNTLTEYADATTDVGKRATAAAQDVKTFSMMIDTLREGAQSGWAQTWEIIFGGFEEGKALWTNLNEVFGGILQRAAESRNELLTEWAQAGGRMYIFDAIENFWMFLQQIVARVKEGFREIFPKTTAQDLYEMSINLYEFSKNLELSWINSKNFKDTVAGLFALLSIGWTIVKSVTNAFIDLYNAFSDGDEANGILKITGDLGRFLQKVDEFLKESDLLENFFERLVDIVQFPIAVLGNLYDVVEKVKNGFQETNTGAFGDAFDDLQSRLEPLLHMGDLFIGWLVKLGEVAHRVGELIGEGFSNIGDWIAENVSGATFDRALDTINTGLFAAIVIMLKKFLSGGANLNVDLTGGLFGTIKESFSAVTEVMQNMQANLKADTLLKIAGALALMAGSIFLLSTIDSEKLATAMTGMLVGMGVFTKLIIWLASSSKLMATIKLPFIVGSLMLLSVAMIGFATAMKIMSTMSIGDTIQALIAMTGALVGIAYALQIMPTDIFKQAAALLLLSVALNAIATALKIFGTMEWDEILRGLTAMAGALVAIAGAMWLMPVDMNDEARALFVLGVAMNAMAIALKLFASIQWEEMLRGFAAMAGMLTIIGAALWLMPTDMNKQAAALFVVGVALNVMAVAMKMFGSIPWDAILRGLTVLAGTMLILTLALNGMRHALPGAAALLVAAAALNVLVPVLITMGLLSWETIIKGLTMLAGVFLILGVAGWALSGVVPIILALGASLLMIGAGFALAGAGALAFATAFAIVVASGVAGIAVLQDMLRSFLDFIAPAFSAVGQGIVAMAGEIAKGGPQFYELFNTLLANMLQSIIDNIPKLAELLATLLTFGLRVIVEMIPKFVEAGIDLIIGFLEAIGKAENISTMADKATKIVIGFMDAIGRNVPKVVDAGFRMVTDLMNGIGNAARDNGPALVDAAANMADGLIDGFVAGIRRLGGKFKEALLNLAKRAFDSVLSYFGINSPSKKMMWVSEMNIWGLVKGVDKYGHRAVEASEGLSRDIVDTMGKSISGLGDMVNGSMDDLRPVITPVLDLSQVQADSSMISRMLAEAKQPVRLDGAYSGARTASSEYIDNRIAALEAAADSSTHLEFTQINNSPRALSAGEIYRQTKSQISVAKGALTTVAD